MIRFAGIEVYEYEQPENFDDDEEIDEDEAFNEGVCPLVCQKVSVS
jgi:hypothetical protein